MPWTLSHPAAVLPLRRFAKRPLTFAGLLIGSMTPDIGYYINRFDLSNFAHTLPGTFVACVPTGLVLLLGLLFFCRPIAYVLPSPHRQALLPLCPGFPRGVAHWLLILLALLVGAWTHTFWDAFTHEPGWFVDRLPWLQQPMVDWWWTTVHVYLFLQEMSTIVGFFIVVLAYWRWLKRQPLPPSASTGSDLWRYLFWASVLVLSFASAVPAAVHYALGTQLRGFLFFRSISFWSAVYSTELFLPLTIIGSSIAYARRVR